MVDGASLSNSFTITATGNITLNGAITLGGMGSSTITLIAGMGNTVGNIMVAGASQLSADTVNFTQDGVFAPDLLLTFIAGSLLDLTTTTTAAQAVHPWMIADGLNLSLTTTGAIMIGRDIEIGAGNLDLEGTALTSTGTGARILSGADVTLTGAATSEGALSITASGQLTLNDNIATTGDASNLVIMGTGGITTAAGIALTSGNNLTISGAITTAATNGDLTLDAAGVGTLTLGGNINLGTGTATLRAGSDTGFAATASSQITAATVVVLFRSVNIGSEDEVTDIANNMITFVNAAGTVVMPDYGFGAPGCDVVAEVCEIIRTGASLVVQPTLASDISITIMASDAGAVLSFTGDGNITLTSPEITITASTIDLGGRMLRLVDGSGGITINGNITGAGEIDATGRTLSLVGSPEISGATISITATLLQTVNSSGVAAAGDLTITATDGLTIRAIDIGTGVLTLTAGDGGTGDIAAGVATPTLTAGTVSLTQDSVFGGTAMFDFASATSLILTTGADQIVHNAWMVADDRALSLTTTGAITVNTNIALVTGNLTLRGATIALGNALDSLAGNAISLTGAITRTGNVALGITALGDITLNSDINTDMGALTLSGTNIFLRGDGGTRTLAGSAVTLTGALDSRVSGSGASANNITITTTTGDITITGDIITSGNGGVLLSGNGGNLNLTATSGNIMITGDITTTGGNGMFDDNTGDGSEDGGNGGNLILTATGNITIDGNINLDAERGEGNNDGSRGNGGNGGNGGGLTLTTTGGNITLTGSVNANGGNGGVVANPDNGGGGGAGGIIILEGDSVMVGLINARSGSGGTHTGEGSLGADGANGSATITATGGNLTLSGDINVDGGAITLIAGGAGAAILNGGVMRTLTAGTVSLTQVGAFDDDLFTIASATSLTLDAGSADQIVHAWIAGGTNRALSLTTTGDISIGRDIATGTSNLTLDGGTLMLTGAARTLSGADIALTGAIGGASALTVDASGALTLNGDINIGAAALSLITGTGVIGGSATMLTAGTVSLEQVDAFASTAPFMFGATTTLLTLTTNAAQRVHGWMIVLNRSLNLTSTGVTRLTSNTIISVGTGDLTLTTTGRIELDGGLTTLVGRNVVLNNIRIDGATNASSFTVTASGNITINNNIDLGGNTGGTLTLTAGMGDDTTTGNIMAVGMPTLAVRIANLRQDGVFAPDALFTFAVSTLNLTTGAAQMVYDWMTAPSRALSLTSTGGSITVGTTITASRNITLTATTLNINADIGADGTPITGSLTLDGAVVFGGMNPSDARAIYATGTTFTGPITSTAALTITTTGATFTGTITSTAALTITTTGTLTITANITIDGDLMLTGGTTGGIVIGTATGAGALTLSGDAITLAGAVTTASTDGAANLTDLTITAQGNLTVAGIDLSNNDNTAYGDLLLVAGAGTRTGSNITFGSGTTLNAARVELRQDADFDPNVARPVTIQIEGTDPGLTGNPATVVISGDTQVPWARVLVTEGSFTIIDGGANDPDSAPNNGIEFDTARLAYTEDIMIDAGALDITFAGDVGDRITWQAANITIIAGSIVLGDRTLTIRVEGGTLTLNVINITSTGNLDFAGTTINLGRTGPSSDLGTTTLTGNAITLTSANGITVGRFTNRVDFSSPFAPALAVNASGVLTLAANITSVANITLRGIDGITVTGMRTLEGSAIRFNSDVTANDSAVTANDGLTVNTTTGNLTLNGNIDIGTGALSLTSAAGIRAFGEATRTLSGGDITLTATNGVSAASGARNFAVTAGGVLTIAADITMRDTLTLQGMGAIVATGRPALTASTVSLTQIDAFAETALFTFGAAADTGSLALTTEAAQDVHAWMIVADRNLTVTSAGTVGVRSAIDLGAGNLMLESTGGLVRIFENITTTGNLTLNGSTGINLNGGGAKTLSGAIITLIGTAQSNRDLTLIASGALTLNSDIDIGTRALSLRGNGGIDLGSALTLSGGDITLTGVIAETANGLTITAGGTLSIINSSINTGTGNLTLTGGTIQIGRRGSDRLIELSGQNVTFTSAGGIEIGRFLGTGDFLVDSRVVNLTVTATGTLTIAADITVADTATAGGDITLTGTGGGIVIGGTTGSSTLTWSGGDITLTGAVTTASTTGTDNFTNLILSAGGNLVVGAIDLDNNAGGTADARGGLILRAGAGSGSGTINVTGGGLTTINAGSIQLEQDGAVFAATEPADFSINGTDVGTGSLRSMVLVLYRGEEEQDSVTWGTVAGADAIVLGTDDNLLTTPIMLFNGILNSLVSITINAGRTGDVTFAGTGDIILAAPVITITAGSINTNDRTLTITTNGGTLTLSSNIATGTGDLTLTSGTIQIGRRGSDRGIELSGQNVTLISASGIEIGRFTGTGDFLVDSRVANLTVTAQDTLTIAADITVADAATGGGIIMLTDLTPTATPIAFTGARRLSGVDITLTGAATGTANLTLTARGTLTLNDNIALTGGTSILTLRGAGAIGDGGTATVLTASTVSLAQVDAFAETALFTFGTTADTGSLVLTTEADQDVYDWMINDGIDLTVTSAGAVFVRSAIDLGAGALSLTGTGGLVRIFANITTTGNLTLNGNTGINLNSEGAKTLSGADITLTGTTQSNRDLTINASGTLRINSNITGRALSLTSTEGAVRILADITARGVLTLSGSSTGGINLNGGGAKTFSGEAITLTGDAQSNRDLTLTTTGALTLNSDIDIGTRALSLSGSSIALGGALTLTGGAIELTGAARGLANLTINASGTLTLNDNIALTGTSSTLALSGAGAIVGVNTPELTASTVRLAQIDTFAATALFTFGTAPATDSLVLITEAAQDVHAWMIVAGRNLTITSAGTVFVRSDIDLGAGALSLTSTGGLVRIFDNITTTGNLTLNGNTGINLNSGGAKTLAGAIITLTGVVASNRDLALNATSGALILNSDITTGTTRALSLSGSSITLGGALTLTGGAIELTGVATGTANDLTLTINASGTLTLNDNIALTGTGSTLALSGADAIVGVGTPELTASTVSLTQIDTFATVAPFTFGAATDTGSLELTTEAEQGVHAWMIVADRALTVTSAGAVVVEAAIDLGAGALSLTSTGGAVRITANITAGGDLTLSGATEINFNGGGDGVAGAKTLSGAAITLTGVVVSNRDLTLTASGTLRINSNITLTEAGALSLTSTGGLVRIFANISSDGNITLSGGTAGINLNGGTAKTISGAAIMITGAARSNRNLTITATGVLTLNSDIIAGTRTLELSGSSITLGGALTLNGRFTTLTGAATGTADLTITASRNLRLNNNIDTGAGNLTLSGGTGSTGGALNLNGGIAVGEVKTFSGGRYHAHRRCAGQSRSDLHRERYFDDQ